MIEAEAGRIVVETITAMAAEGRPLMRRVLPESGLHFWEHYPEDDARDGRTRSRWYYHVHAPGDRDPAEHGHFHLFLHRCQFVPGAEPLVSPAEGEQAAAHVAHLAGMSIDRSGIPIAWFATNRWVTDEFLYPAETLIDHLPFYNVDNTEEDALVNRFLTAMVALYRLELASLLRDRDERLAQLVADAGPSAYEIGNDVLITQPIHIDAKVENLGVG